MMNNSHLSITRQGRGENIILLHGWGMNAGVFEPLSLQLSGNRTAITVDLPGYGASSWQELSFEQQAACMASQLPEGVLLGWSMGGLYAAEMARQFPQQFSRLVLVCCNPCFVRRECWNCAVEEVVFDAFCHDLQRGWQATVKRFLSIQAMGDEHAGQLVRALMMRLENGGDPHPRALQFGLELLKTNDSRELLSELEIPIKMIFGERDALVPKSLVKEIVHVNPRIQVESLATAAHAPFLSHPQQFMAML